MAEIPNAGKYDEATLLNKRFDNRQIERMKEVADQKYTLRFWEPIRDIMLRAWENNNLRPEVRDTFLRLCPYPILVAEVRAEMDPHEEKFLSLKKRPKTRQDRLTDFHIAV